VIVSENPSFAKGKWAPNEQIYTNSFWQNSQIQ
jgi:hypothetical protein